jgi:hypothetical protein
MGRLDLNINDETEKKFRDAVNKSKGMKRGNLTTSLEEAIDAWIEEQAKKLARGGRK